MRITIDIHEGEQKPQIELSQSEEMPAATDAGGPTPELLARLPEGSGPQAADTGSDEQPGGSPPAWLLQAVENERIGDSSPLRAIPIEERFANSEEGFANSEEGFADGGAAPE